LTKIFTTQLNWLQVIMVRKRITAGRFVSRRTAPVCTMKLLHRSIPFICHVEIENLFAGQ